VRNLFHISLNFDLESDRVEFYPRFITVFIGDLLKEVTSMNIGC